MQRILKYIWSQSVRIFIGYVEVLELIEHKKVVIKVHFNIIFIPSYSQKSDAWRWLFRYCDIDITLAIRSINTIIAENRKYSYPGKCVFIRDQL